jgi:hypothetical protein
MAGSYAVSIFFTHKEMETAFRLSLEGFGLPVFTQ